MNVLIEMFCFWIMGETCILCQIERAEIAMANLCINLEKYSYIKQHTDGLGKWKGKWSLRMKFKDRNNTCCLVFFPGKIITSLQAVELFLKRDYLRNKNQKSWDCGTGINWNLCKLDQAWRMSSVFAYPLLDRFLAIPFPSLVYFSPPPSSFCLPVLHKAEAHDWFPILLPKSFTNDCSHGTPPAFKN